MQWGFGHTAGVLLIATLLLLLKEQLPLDAISAYSERIVGVSLIVVGSWGVWKASRAVITPHSHAGASFAMGTIHGLAGSSHLFGVLPALAFSLRVGLDPLPGRLRPWRDRRHVGVCRRRRLFVSIRLGTAVRGLLYASSAAALVIGGFWLVGR